MSDHRYASARPALPHLRALRYRIRMRQRGGRLLVRGGGFSLADAARGFDGGLPVPGLPAQGGASAASGGRVNYAAAT